MIENRRTEFTDRKLRTGVYRKKVKELELTDRKEEIWSLQIVNRRTEFTDRK